MRSNTDITDEMLMAYADGELDAQARAAIEAAMLCDPAIARQIERHRSLRSKLGAAFEDVLREPVPDRLLAAAREAASSPANAGNATSLSAARGRAEKSSRRWSWPEWAAMAASLVIGILLSQWLPHVSGEGVVAHEGGLVARGVLADALSNQLSTESSAGNPVHVALSYRDTSGNYCRAFVMHEDGALAGTACRQGDAWRVDILAQTDASAAQESYRMADTALPQSVLQTVERRIVGEPLDAAAETAARDRKWRP